MQLVDTRDDAGRYIDTITAWAQSHLRTIIAARLQSRALSIAAAASQLQDLSCDKRRTPTASDHDWLGQPPKSALRMVFGDSQWPNAAAFVAAGDGSIFALASHKSRVTARLSAQEPRSRGSYAGKAGASVKGTHYCSYHYLIYFRVDKFGNHLR